nr:MAG TPA: hypothetical protein [Crassvirales sp.]
MVTNIQYTNIRRVLDDITDHPLLRDVTLEQVIRHTIRFISLHGYPQLYQDKIDTVDIKDFRGLLPCDLISIIQVKDLKTDICLRSMTDTFTPGLRPKSDMRNQPKDLLNNMKPPVDTYIPPMQEYREEPAFKTQGRIIFTSFPEGKVEIAYKAIPVDEDGFPLLIDNETYLDALEAYIKVKVFTVKFDTGKIQAGVLSNAQTEYAWTSHLLQSEMTTPSMAEMESMTRYLNTLIKPVRQFDNSFKDLGNHEYLRRH